MNTLQIIYEAVKRVNDKGEKIPEVCPKCGSKIGLYLKGEPVWLCSNKKCEKYFGTLPFKESVNENEMIDDIKLFAYEKCKDLDTARKFVSEVGKLAKKYNANYFVVTDGASGTSNSGNPAVKHARDCQIEWEKKNGFDPDEDWSVNESYEAPYTLDEIEKNYGKEMRNKLEKDPIHNYRATSGIELIHKEPSREELDRIWKNWNNMTPEQKAISDKKSKELFGLTNKENYEKLSKMYESMDEIILESYGVTKFEDNFKTKETDKHFVYMDINSSQASKYLKQDTYCRTHTDFIKKYFNGEIAVDKDSDKLAGFVCVGNEKKDEGWIMPLVVEKKYRGYGIGTRLLNDAIHKFGGIDLCVLKKNKVAIEMYKRHGFEIVCDYKPDKKMHYMKLKGAVIKESTLNRSELPDDVFGIPEKRKFPMPDEKHVRSAIKFFNYVEKKYEKELATNIITNMEKYGISKSVVGEKNRLRKYL